MKLLILLLLFATQLIYTQNKGYFKLYDNEWDLINLDVNNKGMFDTKTWDNEVYASIQKGTLDTSFLDYYQVYFMLELNSNYVWPQGDSVHIWLLDENERNYPLWSEAIYIEGSGHNQLWASIYAPIGKYHLAVYEEDFIYAKSSSFTIK